MTLRKKEILVCLGIIILFLVMHIPGLHIPYHQDEYKWPNYANPALSEPGVVPHPPLAEFIYRVIGFHIGYDNFRFIPFFFGTLNLLLIFYLVQIIFDKRTAFWAAALYTISFYSLLASLMVDVDGAIMPFFLLLLLIGYYKWKERGYSLHSSSLLWILLALIGGIGGFLVKVITALPIFALALDFAIEKNMLSDKKKVFKSLLYALGGAVALVIILLLSKLVFPYFKLEYSFEHWDQYVNFGTRGWFQTFIQFTKAILYTSPLLALPLVFAGKEIWKKVRPLTIFLILELVTYLLVFDFSTGALDRYFEFLVVPLCIIAAAVFSDYFSTKNNLFSKKSATVLGIGAIVIFLFQFLNQAVPPLYPKTEWVYRIMSLKWNFLYPFFGGSGPFPFYISFGFIGLSWVFTIAIILFALWKKDFRKKALFMVLFIGVLYNAVFAEEYLFGKINGSATPLLLGAVQFIKDDPTITKVVVYNDNGGFNIQEIGKYEKRLYTSPEFDIVSKTAGLNKYKDFYLELNIPRIDPTSVYRRYLDSCTTIYDQSDHYISAIVHDCRDAPTIAVPN